MKILFRRPRSTELPENVCMNMRVFDVQLRDRYVYTVACVYGNSNSFWKFKEYKALRRYSDDVKMTGVTLTAMSGQPLLVVSHTFCGSIPFCDDQFCAHQFYLFTCIFDFSLFLVRF